MSNQVVGISQLGFIAFKEIATLRQSVRVQRTKTLDVRRGWEEAGAGQ